jgi:hypothetical protein
MLRFVTINLALSSVLEELIKGGTSWMTDLKQAAVAMKALYDGGALAERRAGHQVIHGALEDRLLRREVF